MALLVNFSRLLWEKNIKFIAYIKYLKENLNEMKEL